MYCRKCGKLLPEDSLFCTVCGSEVIPEAESVQKQEKPVKIFNFEEDTTYDRASAVVNDWLSRGGIRICSAEFVMDAVLLAGTMVPSVAQVSIRWETEEGGKPYQMGIMMESRADLGLTGKKGMQQVERHYEQWRKENPDVEIAGKQEDQIHLGWSNLWTTCFFYR